MIALEGTLLYGFIFRSTFEPYLSQLPQRPTESQDMALSRALGPGDTHPAPHVFIVL